MYIAYTYVYFYIFITYLAMHVMYVRIYKYRCMYFNLYSDINECEGAHNCSQICNNQIGSFNCECMDGYILQADEKQCLGNAIWYFKCMCVCKHVRM